MGVMIRATEPFYKAKGESPDPKLLHFRNIWYFETQRVKIEKYAKAHDLKLEKLQQTFYSHKRNELMMGFEEFVET